MNVSSRAQAATEYLMITGFVFMILLPLVYLVFNYTQESSGDIATAQINKIGRDLVNNAESVYYFSNPSKVTLDVNMPDSVLNLTIVNNPESSGCKKCTELRFILQASKYKQTLAFSSKIPLRGEDYRNETYPHYSIFNRTSFSTGVKHFRIEAKQDHVFITTSQT